MAYQSLYRRYRPKKFGEIIGQEHVVRALQTAVREGRVSHAYMLHGPRGTGKTTTARVLAKALNCENLGDDGEPCCECESCASISVNRSYDLHELDAASNNKVDDMRSLLERVNLATPGRVKVYLLDEVHMLTTGAENALLKTLEEPPSHVTWVLATTEPHKVAETIRSRCQVFELGLVSADVMAGHVRHVVADAVLDVDDAQIDQVLSAGAGSVRDTLTALDRAVAGGGVADMDGSTDAMLLALADRDAAAALAAVGDALGRGRSAHRIGETVLAGLRDAFLTAMGDPPPRLSEAEQARAADLAGRMKPAAITHALETLGRAMIDMRQSPDPRVDIDIALVRLCRDDGDLSPAGLLERLQRLEERVEAMARAAPSVAAGSAGLVGALPPSPIVGASGSAGVSDRSSRGPAREARRALSQSRESTRRDAGAQVGAKGSAPSLPTSPPSPTPDLLSLRPRTPTEVVELAQLHLGIDKETVVARARELLPSAGKRDADELALLWQDLVAKWSRSSVTESSSPVVAAPSDREPGVGPGAGGGLGGGPVVAAPSDPEPAPSDPDNPTVMHDPAAAYGAARAGSAGSGFVSENPAGFAAGVVAGPHGAGAASSEAGLETKSAAHQPLPHAAATAVSDAQSLRGSDEDYIDDISELAAAPAEAGSIEEHIDAVFPGAEIREVSSGDAFGADR